jgi:hypothetical protein
LGKFSGAPERFVEPDLDTVVDELSAPSRLLFGAFGWNTAILSEDERETAIDAVVRRRPVVGREREMTRAFFEELIERKLAQSGTDTRWIVDFDGTDTGGRYHLKVMCASPLPGGSQWVRRRDEGLVHRLTFASLTVPSTVVLARLPSGSERRHENRDRPLGSLTTTRGLVGDPPVTVVARLDPSARVVPPSTT